MINVMLDILILIFAILTYRDMKIKRVAVKQNGKDFVAMRLYKEHWNAEHERKSEAKTDPDEPEFGQGWFPYVVRRDFEEMKRQREQHHDKTS